MTIRNTDIITELHEEEWNMDGVDVEAEDSVDELTSKKSNIQWVSDSDVLEVIVIGVQSNIFAQVSIRITPAMYLAKIGSTKKYFITKRWI